MERADQQRLDLDRFLVQEVGVFRRCQQEQAVGQAAQPIQLLDHNSGVGPHPGRIGRPL